MANARLRDQTVLFTSRNHKAIDAVVERLNVNAEKPLVVRANSKEDSFNTFGFKEAIRQLLGDAHDHNSKERWNNVRDQFMDKLIKRGDWGKEADRIQYLRDKLGGLEQQMANISEKWTPDMIIEVDKEIHSFPTKDIKRLENSIGVLRDKGEAVNLFTRLFWWFKSLIFGRKIQFLDRYLRKKCSSWQSATQKSGFLKLRETAIQNTIIAKCRKIL